MDDHLVDPMDPDHSTPGEGDESEPRATLCSAAAGSSWPPLMVPVIVVAQAIPAAASGQGVIQFTGTACRHVGNSSHPFDKDYHLSLLAVNTTGAPVTPWIHAIWAGSSADTVTPTPFAIGTNVAPLLMDAQPLTPPIPNGGQMAYVLHVDGTNSGNVDLYLKVIYSYLSQADMKVTISTFTGSLPQCDSSAG